MTHQQHYLEVDVCSQRKRTRKFWRHGGRTRASGSLGPHCAQCTTALRRPSRTRSPCHLATHLISQLFHSSGRRKMVTRLRRRRGDPLAALLHSPHGTRPSTRRRSSSRSRTPTKPRWATPSCCQRDQTYSEVDNVVCAAEAKIRCHGKPSIIIRYLLYG